MVQYIMKLYKGIQYALRNFKLSGKVLNSFQEKFFKNCGKLMGQARMLKGHPF